MDKHDEFCWHCHKNETEIDCAKCVRSFHRECISANGEQVEVNLVDDDDDEWTCSICSELKISEMNQSPEHLKMLPLIVKHFWDKSKFDTLWDSLRNMYLSADVNIVNPMDLYKIKENAEAYTSFDALITDVKWMSHNISILGSDNQKYIKDFDKLIEFINFEIEYMKKCTECYSNYKLHSDWFTLVCSKPHCIVWAKVGHYRYWPGKLISVGADNKLHVRFFGDYSHDEVAVNKCYLYSKESPDHLATERRQRRISTADPKFVLFDPEYKAALKEVDLYIANIRKKFGSFHFAEVRTAFDPALLEQYTLQMISGVADSNSKKRTSSETASSSSAVESSYEPAEKKSRSTDEVDDHQNPIGQSDADASEIDPSKASAQKIVPTSSESNECQRNIYIIDDLSGLNQGFVNKFDIMVTAMREMIEANKSQLIVFKKIIYGLEKAHAKDIVALKQTQHALAEALIENTSTLNRVAALQLVVDEKDKIIMDLKSQIEAGKLRTAELQRIEQEYRNKLNELRNNFMSVFSKEGTSASSENP